MADPDAPPAHEPHRRASPGLRGEPRAVVGGSSSVDECEYRDVWLYADKNSVSYFASTYNACTDEGSAVFGDAKPSVFEVGKRLSSARVVATVQLWDLETGAFVRTLEIRNTWTATGPAVKSRWSSSETVPGEFRFTSRSTGSMAPAAVSGTVPLDGGSIGKFTEFSAGVVR